MSDSGVVARRCMVADCESEPGAELVVDSGGLLLVFSICGEHFTQTSGGYLFEAPTDLRGFIGLVRA